MNQTATGAGGILGPIMPFLPLILLFVLMWFMLIRPQQTQQRKRREMLGALRKGDKIVTLGGIHGVITEIDNKEDLLTVRIADKVDVQVSRQGVSNLQKGG